MINIYEDENAYVSPAGTEQPAKRNRQGDSSYSVRHETRLERVLGAADGSLEDNNGQAGTQFMGPAGPKVQYLCGMAKPVRLTNK